MSNVVELNVTDGGNASIYATTHATTRFATPK